MPPSHGTWLLFRNTGDHDLQSYADEADTLWQAIFQKKMDKRRQAANSAPDANTPRRQLKDRNSGSDGAPRPRANQQRDTKASGNAGKENPRLHRLVGRTRVDMVGVHHQTIGMMLPDPTVTNTVPTVPPPRRLLEKSGQARLLASKTRRQEGQAPDRSGSAIYPQKPKRALLNTFRNKVSMGAVTT